MSNIMSYGIDANGMAQSIPDAKPSLFLVMLTIMAAFALAVFVVGFMSDNDYWR